MKKTPTTLISPATGAHTLVEIEVGGITLDVCPATGGIWFDRFELDRFDEAHEAHELLLDLPYDPEVTVDSQSRRRSPKAPEVVMMRQGFGASREIEIDVCPATGGVWLDRGELQRIHDLFPTAEDRKAAAMRFAAAILAEKTADLREQERQDTVQSGMMAFARLLRWLSPSYHLRQNGED